MLIQKLPLLPNRPSISPQITQSCFITCEIAPNVHHKTSRDNNVGRCKRPITIIIESGAGHWSNHRRSILWALDGNFFSSIYYYWRNYEESGSPPTPNVIVSSLLTALFVAHYNDYWLTRELNGLWRSEYWFVLIKKSKYKWTRKETDDLVWDPAMG